MSKLCALKTEILSSQDHTRGQVEITYYRDHTTAQWDSVCGRVINKGAMFHHTTRPCDL